MSWTLGIPSWRRADVVNDRSLRTLADAGVARERVHLFVAREELDAYRATVDPGLVNEIVPHDHPADVAGAHNFLQDYLGPGQVMHMDDDIAGFSRRVDEKTLERVTDLNAVIARGWATARARGAALWGIYSVHNPYFMRSSPTTKLGLVIGHLFGTVISGRAGERTTLRCKNDYQRTLRFFMMDGVVVRLRDIVADTKVYAGKGGLIEQRTPEVAQEAIDALMREFPGLVRPKKSSGPMPEIRLVPPRP